MLQRIHHHCLRRFTRFDDKHDLPDQSRQHLGFRRRQQRRAVEYNDAVGVACGNFIHQRRHAVTGEQFGNIVVMTAGGEHTKVGDIGGQHHIRDSKLLVVDQIDQSGTVLDAQQAADATPRNITINQQHSDIFFARDGQRQIGRSIRLALTRHRAGHHNQIASVDQTG